MANTDRFMVVHFPEPQVRGDELPAWPQHMTVVPWAQGDLLLASYNLEAAAQTCEPFTAEIVEQEMFGPNADIPVFTFDKTELLNGLHQAILGAVVGTAELEDSSYVLDSYNPHITPKHGQPEVAIGDKFLIDQLTVVEKIGNARHVYMNLPLGA